MAQLQNVVMPTGWDCKIDKKTGKPYYVNHFTKTTTWDDPRKKQMNGSQYGGQSSEYIPMQLHGSQGSPDLKRNSVYPSQANPIPAFQMAGQGHSIYIPLKEMRSSSATPSTMRKVQDSSFIVNPDEAVTKISSMFPTVSETHIRLLLKKYHNREAVVISALQVEKHPIITPGPFATPPPSKRPNDMLPPLQGIRTFTSSRTNSPISKINTGSPRPHSSPKLKLRYMKSIFPEADENLILDTLTSNDNNIQKASELLKEMGFSKRDVAKAKEEKIKVDVDIIEVVNLIKSPQEKNSIKRNLQEHYNNVPERVVLLALESAQYDKDRANQILQIMVDEDEKNIKEKADEEVTKEDQVETTNELKVPSSVATSQSRQSIKSILKEKLENNKTTFSRVIEKNVSTGFKSQNLSSTQGSNPSNVHGPNEKLLLEDYVKWQGPNPKNRTAVRSEAKGPNKANLSIRNYTARGPMFGLAKGSIFSQLKTVTIGGEARSQ